MRNVRFPQILLLGLLLTLPACRDAEGWILVQNDTASTVTAVFIDPCEATSPATDRLGGGTIAPGARTAFQVEFGCWEVVARAEGGLEGRWTVGVNSVERRVVVVAQPQQP